MLLSISGFELLALVVVSLPTVLLLATRGYGSARWLIAFAICFALAAICSPADLLSTIVLSAVLFGALLLGARMRLFDKPAVTS